MGPKECRVNNGRGVCLPTSEIKSSQSETATRPEKLLVQESKVESE